MCHSRQGAQVLHWLRLGPSILLTQIVEAALADGASSWASAIHVGTWIESPGLAPAIVDICRLSKQVEALFLCLSNKHICEIYK